MLINHAQAGRAGRTALYVLLGSVTEPLLLRMIVGVYSTEIFGRLHGEAFD